MGQEGVVAMKIDARWALYATVLLGLAAIGFSFGSRAMDARDARPCVVVLLDGREVPERGCYLFGDAGVLKCVDVLYGVGAWRTKRCEP